MRHRVVTRFVTACIAAIAAFASIVVFHQDRPNHHIVLEREREERCSGALQALDFWTRARAYPDADIPADKYYRAFQVSKSKHREISSTLTAGSIWDPIGPTNLQGRALSVAINPINPNTVYVGTASGGLWRSYTGGLGSDWQRMALGYSAIGISAIVIDPTDTNTIYVGTGEVYRYQGALGGVVVRTTRGSYGIGILKTTNGGTTWTKSLDWSYQQQRGIQAMKMNPLNHNTIWAATTQGVYKSTDAGATWTNLWGVVLAEDVVINSVDTNKVLVSFGNFSSSGTGVYRTTDGGGSWTLLGGITPYSGKTMLEMYAAHPNVVYASTADSTHDFGALYRTTDFGTTWTKLYDALNASVYQVQGWYSHFVAVHPTDSSQVFLAGVPPFKSTDGGRTFFGSGGDYVDHHGYAHHPTNPNILYVVNDDGTYRSTNFGASFTKVDYGMQSGQIYNGFSCSSSDSLLALGQSQDHIPGYRYLGSNVWDHSSAVDEVGWTAINPLNDNNMFAVYRFGDYVYRSTNRGASFSWVLSAYSSEGSWNSPIVVAPSNPSIVYFANKRIYKSATGGSSWTQSPSNIDGGNPALSMAAAATSADTVFVGTAPISAAAHIFRTTDGGTTWTNVTGSLPNRYPMDIAVDPTNSRIVYVAYGGFGIGHLFKSTDAGTNWTDITGTLPDIPTTAIAVDPLHSNNLYVGNDFGVYVSTNGGATWSEFNDGLPDAVIVADLTISPSNRALRAATHGNGVWERKLVGELPSGYFDYKAAALVSPTDGAQFDSGAVIQPIQASFRNVSMITGTGGSDVQYRILRNGTESYASTVHISPLASGESRTVTFDGNFIPLDTGRYELQAITLAADSNSSNDTLRGSLYILTPPNVQNFVVTKDYCPYTEIVGGSPGPSGDDVQSRVDLPFVFKYDGYSYDSVQISTNGWIEFGTGAQGSMRGLSTDGQLTGYFRATLGTNDRPTKAVGPWWTDLSTFGSPVGEITYATIGSSPNRTFVVQWKDVLANYDPTYTTTHINFQVRLRETTNEIEIDYGPVLVGSFSGAGASMGLKDYIGGDYRYYDLTRFGTGPSSELRSDLNPVANWPGQDSCYHIQTNPPPPPPPAPESVAVSVSARWNLVSNPMVRTDRAVKSIYPTSSSASAFAYDGMAYQPADSLREGKGYWLRFSSEGTQSIVGQPLHSVVVPVAIGWNLIGSVDHVIPAPHGGIVVSEIYGYDRKYITVDSLIPGKGYWVKVRSTSTLLLGGSQTTPKTSSKEIVRLDNQTAITLTDNLGRSQTLYLAENTDGALDLSRFEMPPIPPTDAFDVRFASQRMLEELPSDVTEAHFPVQIQSVSYPLMISVSAKHPTKVNLAVEEMMDGNVIATHALSSKNTVTISSGGASQLVIRVTSGKALPAQFALKQNYPNPFNPSTTIGFDLPAKSTVSLKVYDIAGRLIMTLVEGEYEAGRYSVTASFADRASGVYLYRLEAGSFTDVKKLVVTK